MAKLPVRTNMSELVRRELAADCVSLSRQLSRRPGVLIKSQIGTIVQPCG